MIKISDVICHYKSSIKNTIRVIDRVGLRIAYLVDDKKKLVGVVTDSEIRKAIIKGINIQDSVESIINKNPIILTDADFKKPLLVKRNARKLKKLMPDSGCILVVDKNNKPYRLIPLTCLIGQKNIHKVNNISNVKRVLIVGGAGYLGSVLVGKLLKMGYKVRILDLLMYNEDSIKKYHNKNNFELINGDMRNISTVANSLHDVDAVINLAAIVGDPACNDKPEAAIETNYLANKALAEAVKYNQINRFIYASSCSVYGTMKENEILDENSPLNPVSLYARSKIQSEEGILDIEDENFAPTILRMSTLYGLSPRMRFDLVVNAMTKSATIDKKIDVFNGGKQWRPLLNVEDAANAYIKCLQAPIDKIKGEIFNVGSSDQNYQIIDIARAVKKIVPNTKIMVHSSNVDPRDYNVSFKKIKKVLNYRIEQTLLKSIIKISQAIKSGKLTDVNNSKYYNINILRNE